MDNAKAFFKSMLDNKDENIYKTKNPDNRPL